MAYPDGLSTNHTVTYVDASTFKVSGETDKNGVPFTDIFTEGRRVRADCGADGIVYSESVSASYDSTADETTVTLDDAVLTSNLSDVWFGVSGENALPKHSHTGDASGGALTLGGLTDVDVTSAKKRSLLEWDGTTWHNVIAPDFKEVYNNTASQIAQGVFVAIVGLAGAVPFAAIADKDSDTEVAGITIEAIDPGMTGLIQLQGTIQEGFINTSDMTSGNPIYLGNDGGFVDSRPSSGNIINLGKVGVVAPSSGSLLLDCPAIQIDFNDLGNIPQSFAPKRWRLWFGA